MRPVRCPCCRLKIDGKHVWDHRNCAVCRAEFTIRRRYLVTTYALAVFNSSGIAFAIGNRGTALASLAALLLLPTFWVMLAISLRLFPLDIEVVRGGWTPSESDEDRELERTFEVLRELDPVVSGPEPEVQAPMLAESRDGELGRLPLSAPVDAPVSLEGIVIAIAFAALLAWHLYAALEPHIDVGVTPTESAAPLPSERQGR
jgi:hypothetical protein